MLKYRVPLSEKKSRRDNTLLTVDFNLRKRNDQLHAKSCKDDTAPSQLGEGWGGACTVPAGLGRLLLSCLVRRLKSTVKHVPSLRDFAITNCNQHIAIDLAIILNF